MQGDQSVSRYSFIYHSNRCDMIAYCIYSVISEQNDPSMAVPKTYNDLIGIIQSMTMSNTPDVTNEKGKSILVKLFPSWLLPAFQVMFAKPFPQFSCWMNAWVTHWTTGWLMGPSKIYDVVTTGSDGSPFILKEQGLLVEKCTFLETCECIRTCTHACKIPTQRFFSESMGLPLTLKPNLTDYSCKFEFGVVPVPLDEDEISSHPCLKECSFSRKLSQEPCLT